MLLSVTACQLPENSKRVASRAVSTFVLQSAIVLQGRTVLTQSSARPALQTVVLPSSAPKVCIKRITFAKRVFIARCPLADPTKRPFPTT
jgi:hypothetical protein